jgi:crossover junction endodeoxyribonuclease RuvC
LPIDAPVRRILGIDPGLRVTGFGILVQHGNKLVYVTSGCIRATGASLPVRLGIIARDIAHVIAEERPTEVAVEKVFVNVNPN